MVASAQGQDYSSWQSSMDLTGLQFVIVRATLGDGSLSFPRTPGAVNHGVDAMFAPFWKQALAIHRGAYHFFYPSLDPVVQADLFVHTVKARGLNDGDMLFCDSETAAGNVDSVTKKFCDRVRSQVPASCPVGVYANHDIGQHLVSTAAAYPDTYWFAYPSSTAPSAALIAPWKAWRFWQWGQRGVDQDAFNGTAAALDTWIASYQPTPPPPPAPPGWTESIMQDLPNLAQGATGNDVRTAQGLLAARGHAVEPGTPDLGIDGIFGPATDAVVRSVQQGWGLTVDGIIGQKTWAKLLNR